MKKSLSPTSCRCPPCRGFTPVLAETYKTFKANHSRKEDFTTVFISSDKDQESFASYFAEMPWLALPFEKRDLKAKLSSKFKVQGIPSLIILDGFTGEVITNEGRNAIMEDPEGQDFPWKPKSLRQLLSGAELVNNKGEAFKAEEQLEGKIKLIYFSAHWCPPCRGFTPVLAELYKSLKAAGKDFEIVFVSSDRDESSFQEYLATMPWLALAYSDRATKGKLSNKFGVSGIPSLIVLDESDNIITHNGRGAVAADPQVRVRQLHTEPLLTSPHLNFETPL
jgi:nucleoredoxin